MRVRNLDSSSMEAVEVMVVVMVDSEDRLRSIVSYVLFSSPFMGSVVWKMGKNQEERALPEGCEVDELKEKTGLNGRRNGMN